MTVLVATIHRFLHFAVMTLAAGGDIYTLRTLMGHSNIKTTQIYADIVMDKKVDAISKISEYFSKNPIINNPPTYDYKKTELVNANVLRGEANRHFFL